jgi:hypothetical protein
MDKEHKQLRSTAKRWPRFWLWTGFAALSFQVCAQQLLWVQEHRAQLLVRWHVDFCLQRVMLCRVVGSNICSSGCARCT